jgi:hypothetical protein
VDGIFGGAVAGYQETQAPSAITPTTSATMAPMPTVRHGARRRRARGCTAGAESGTVGIGRSATR